MLELGPADLAAVVHRRVRPDVAVGDRGVLTDDGRAADVGVDHHRALLDDDPALDARRGVDAAVDARLDRLEHQTVALEQRLELAGVLPPTVEHLVTDLVAVVDQPLDRVGDLQLAPGGRLDRLHRIEDRGVEQVHADERQVRRRNLGLLDQGDHVAVLAELGDTEALRVLDPCQQDLRRGRLRRTLEGQLGRRGTVGDERLDELGDALAQQVVAQVHDEVVAVEEVLGDEDAVGQPAGFVLGQVGDADTPLRAVADRRADLVAGLAGDDADVGDPGRGHVLDPVEEDRLVGHGDQLLGARMGDRPQPCPGAAGEDEALHDMPFYQESAGGPNGERAAASSGNNVRASVDAATG